MCGSIYHNLFFSFLYEQCKFEELLFRNCYVRAPGPTRLISISRVWCMKRNPAGGSDSGRSIRRLPNGVWDSGLRF